MTRLNAPRAAAVLLLLAAPLQAGGAGTTSSSFLKVPANARAVGMAGAYTAVSGDSAAMEYNPAGLAGLKRTDIHATYLDYFEDSSFQVIGFGFPFQLTKRRVVDSDDDRFPKGQLDIGLQYRLFSVDDTARNDVGVEQGSIGIRDQALQLGVAAPITSAFALGAGVKFIRQQLEDESLSNFAADAGAVWKAPRGFSVGAAILNLGPSRAFDEEKDPLPTQLRVGANRTFGRVLLALDLAQGRDSVTRVALGSEWSVARFLKLRGGAFHQTTPGFTAGLGLQIAGPQKSVSMVRSAPARSSREEGELSFNERRAADLLERLSTLALDLTDRFETSRRRASDYDLAVLPPSGTSDRMGAALGDLLGQQFDGQGAFNVADRSKVDAAVKTLGYRGSFIDDSQAARVGRAVGAEAVVVSQLLKGPTGYGLQSRIILVQEESAAAAAAASLPADIFVQKQRLGDKPVRPASGERMDLGLDYGLTTTDELGISHTISLRLLY